MISPKFAALTASKAWLLLLRNLLHEGEHVAPRGKQTVELLHNSISVSMLNPIVLIAERKLNYSFAAAEALWILRGDNRLATLTKYNSKMAEFSDDGQTLAGAYGPKIVNQLNYVVNCLVKDRESRQAVLTIWERNPPPSKDIPCTIAMQFVIRNSKLHLNVFMRSSDAWLGVPYDIFSFSMVAAQVACECNIAEYDKSPVSLGNLYLTMGSSHLYKEHWETARAIIGDGYCGNLRSSETSRSNLLNDFINRGSFEKIICALEACADRTDDRNAAIWRIRP